jgi:hypothetical protein
VKPNTWMNNTQYLAQVGHFFGAYGIVLTTLVFTLVTHHGWTPIVWVLSLGVVYATVKEFYYDMRYELPKQTWGDSAMDFAFLVLGGAVAALVSFFALRYVGC